MVQKELREIRRMQRQDLLLERWSRYVIDGRFPDQHMGNKGLTMRKQFKSPFVRRGTLFRNVKNGDKVVEQLLLPEVYKEEVLRGLHNGVGHPGIERTVRLLRERLFQIWNAERC